MPYFEPSLGRVLPGSFTFSTLPSASTNANWLGWCSDLNTYCESDGVKWKPINTKKIETFIGTTDGNGDYSIVYSTPYPSLPHVNPVLGPGADSVTRVRVTASSVNGFTVKSEKNSTVTVLTIDVLAIGTANVPNVPVKVFVVEG